MKAVSLLVALAIAVVGPPPARAADDGALLSGYSITSWTLADGIPVGAVNAIVQDREGYLWLGTTSGVVRFDGARFSNADLLYQAPPTGAVHALALAPDGTLWIGFDQIVGGSTVGAVRRGVFTTAFTGVVPQAATMSVQADRKGRVWAVSGGALHRLHLGRWDVVRDGALGRAFVVSVREDRRGAIWVGTRHGVFRSLDGRVFDLVEAGVARETSADAGGALWMTDPVHGARRQGSPASLTGIDGLGMRLLHDSRGNLWVATTGQGLWRVRGATATTPVVERATMQTGLSSDVVQSLLEDREGNIWVGTTLGLHSLTPQEFTLVASGTLVRAVLPENDGTVWVGTASGLMQFRQEGGTWRGQRVGGHEDIWSLFRDKRGSPWAATSRGLQALVGGRLVATMASGDVAPRCSAGATLGVPATSGTPDLRRVITVSTSAPPGPLEEGGEPRAFCVSHDELWSAGVDGGVTVQRAGGTIVHSPAAAGDTRPHVDAIFEDGRGTIWAGGTAGLWRIREGTVEQVGEPDGLPARRVMAITESADGFLWLAVDRGSLHTGRRAALIRLHPSDFDRAVNTRTQVAGYRIYDVTHGLAGVPLGTVAAARSRDGSLWFSFGGNLNVVDPRHLAEEASRPPAVASIVGVTIDDRVVSNTRPGVLPAGTRKVQVDYSALRLTAPRQTRFRYRLDGFDRDWVEAGPRRQAYYTNLDPGEYVFRVQANGDGATWTVPEALWAFAVQPAFHQTAWFYVLCGSVLLLMVWGGGHARGWILNRQFAATLAERTRLSREIHDTMLQSLVGIALQVQAIARRGVPEGSEQQSQLVALRRQVEQYIREARQAIQNLRSPMLDARGLAGALAEIGHRTVTPPACFDLSADAIDGASPATEGELLRIAQEGIANAARHAGATRIHVDLRQGPDAVRLSVTDDGRGFDVAAMLAADTGHYGLTGMHERAARIGGRLRVTSTAGGTVVEAIVPCARRRA